jgi:opacity protein-like surface antigen
VLATFVMASLAAAASAQDKRVEFGATAGWTFSDGVSGAATDRFGNEFSRIDPKDSFSWNVRLGYMVNENAEVGALYGAQPSALVIGLRTAVGGQQDFELGDQTIRHYHGYFAYNFGESESVKPYVLLGLGATQFGGVTVNIPGVPVRNDGQQHSIGGNTKFSTTWALGLKLFPSPGFGIRLEGRWTPTYIKSDAAGYWCDPYWGCYTVGNAQYNNQFELGGGLTLRF